MLFRSANAGRRTREGDNPFAVLGEQVGALGGEGPVLEIRLVEEELVHCERVLVSPLQVGRLCEGAHRRR